jgi:succinyl-CoA synthetase beta subunit
LIEYEGKQLFVKYGIKIPDSMIISRDEYVDPPKPSLNYPLVVKGQYPYGGRGKSGAVKIANNYEEYIEAINSIAHISVGGVKPRYILIEEFVPHEKEYYLSIIMSRKDKKPVILVSKYGGIDVEELAGKPGSLMSLEIDPLIGYSDYHAKMVSKFLLNRLDKELMDMVRRLYRLFIENDVLLVEINPLSINESPIALDSKVMLDDNAYYRHDYTQYIEYSMLASKGEQIARKHGFSFVPLDGDIGVIGNGAGLVMATVDLVNYYGGSPACFLDVGGGASSERIQRAIEVIANELNIRSLLINIFAGITRCDEVARGIVQAKKLLEEMGIKVVVRLVGTNEDLGASILRDAGFKVYKEMDVAAMEAIKNEG